jgi:hypothetical protein
VTLGSITAATRCVITNRAVGMASADQRCAALVQTTGRSQSGVLASSTIRSSSSEPCPADELMNASSRTTNSLPARSSIV